MLDTYRNRQLDRTIDGFLSWAAGPASLVLGKRDSRKEDVRLHSALIFLVLSLKYVVELAFNL